MTLSLSLPVVRADHAERVIAGSVLRESDCLHDVRALVTADDFADYPARLVFITAGRLADADSGRRVDPAAVLLELKRQGLDEDLGLKPELFLADLLDLAPTAANAVPAAKQVREAAVLRASVGAAAELMRDAASPTGPAEELIQTHITKLTAVVESRSPLDEPEPIAAAMCRAGIRYDGNGRGEGTIRIPTGFEELDRVLVGGLRPEELVYIGARTAKGKSVLLRQITFAAAEAGHPALWFGLEMSTDETVDRLVADSASVPLARLRGASRMTADEVDRFVNQQERLSRLPLYLDQRKSLTVAQIAATARRMVRKKGVRLVAVDYLQLLQPENRKAARYEQVGQISRDLKVLAAELKVVVAAAVQVSREAAGGEVELHHLRESGSLEQDGNVVLLLHERDAEQPEGGLRPFTLKVAKQRSGPENVAIHLALNGKYTRFEPCIPL